MTTTEIKTRPIIFIGESVRAILDGTKTMTRRVVKRPPCDCDPWVPEEVCNSTSEGWQTVGHSGRWWCEICSGDWLNCPFGVPGERLWVRETFAKRTNLEPDANTARRLRYTYYRASYDGDLRDEWHPFEWKPSIHMPRWTSRLTLEVVSVRVERVQEMTAADALDEGIDLPIPPGCEIGTAPEEYKDWNEARRDQYAKGKARAIYFARCADAQDHIDAYAKLWDKINAKRGYSWKSNPWVWVVEFKKLEDSQ